MTARTHTPTLMLLTSQHSTGATCREPQHEDLVGILHQMYKDDGLEIEDMQALLQCFGKQVRVCPFRVWCVPAALTFALLLVANKQASLCVWEEPRRRCLHMGPAA